MDSTGYAISHASRIRRGLRIPDPQHWTALQADLAAVTGARTNSP